jgi:predicted nucleotidyltransferase
MNSLINENIDQIRQLCIEHNVKGLFAFGSIVTDKFSEDSDIDLIVSFKPMDFGDYADNYFVLADKFEALFNRPVDLITENSLSNPYFIETVNKTKTKLYGN